MSNLSFKLQFLPVNIHQSIVTICICVNEQKCPIISPILSTVSPRLKIQCRPDKQYSMIPEFNSRHCADPDVWAKRSPEDSWEQIWSPQESMERTCCMNYTRTATDVCFGTSAAQSFFSNTENVHRSMLSVHYVADLFWQRSWVMTSPVTCSVVHHWCLSFSISGLQRLRSDVLAPLERWQRANWAVCRET